MVNFGIVFAVLYVFALKPLNKLMKERGERIAKGIDDAKANAEILKATQIEFNAILAKAKNEANVFSQNSKKETMAERASMIEDAKAEVESIIASGRKTLEADKVKIVEEARKEIIDLAVIATDKLISSKPDLDKIS